MARFDNTFDAETVPEDDFELLPAGEYLAQVIESDITATNRGDGQILKLTWEIMEGPTERRRVWQRLNIVNPNPDAQRIAQQELARITRALGLGPIDDSEVLHFKPAIIKVGIRKDKTGEYRDQNDIKGCRPASEPAAGRSAGHAAPARPQPRPSAPAATPQAANGASPGRAWNRNRA